MADIHVVVRYQDQARHAQMRVGGEACRLHIRAAFEVDAVESSAPRISKTEHAGDAPSFTRISVVACQI